MIVFIDLVFSNDVVRVFCLPLMSASDTVKVEGRTVADESVPHTTVVVGSIRDQLRITTATAGTSVRENQEVLFSRPGIAAGDDLLDQAFLRLRAFLIETFPALAMDNLGDNDRQRNRDSDTEIH